MKSRLAAKSSLITTSGPSLTPRNDQTQGSAIASVQNSGGANLDGPAIGDQVFGRLDERAGAYVIVLLRKR